VDRAARGDRRWFRRHLPGAATTRDETPLRLHREQRPSVAHSRGAEQRSPPRSPRSSRSQRRGARLHHLVDEDRLDLADDALLAAWDRELRALRPPSWPAVVVAMKSAGRRCQTRRSCAASAIWLVGSASRSAAAADEAWLLVAGCRSASSDPMRSRRSWSGCSSDAGKSFFIYGALRWFAAGASGSRRSKRRTCRTTPASAQTVPNGPRPTSTGARRRRASGSPDETGPLKARADTAARSCSMAANDRAADPAIGARRSGLPSRSALDSTAPGFRSGSSWREPAARRSRT